MDIHALRKRGWSISAIARHVGRDRKTVRAYLDGRTAGRGSAPAGTTRSPRTSSTARLGWTRTRICGRPTLFDEVTAGLSTGRIRRSPGRCGCGVCGRCASRVTRRRAAVIAIIEHPAGRGNPVGLGGAAGPTGGCGGTARRHTCWSGRLSHSAVAWRAVARSMDQPHLVDALHRVAPVGWADPGLAVRPDVHRRAPGDGEGHRHASPASRSTSVSRSDLPAAAREPQRASVEKANHTAAQRWWRTLPDDVTAAQAQAAGPVLRTDPRRHPPPSHRGNRRHRC